MKYMIHSCNQRQWYVDKYLVPLMLKQGIKKDNIYVYQDKTGAGNLVSWVVSCHLAQEMWGDNENVWHLQDDVLLSTKFKERTEELEEFNGVVQGFACDYDKIAPGVDYITEETMWWSMPCIRINSKIGKLFATWADLYVWRDPQYGFWVRHKKGDDLIFKIYMINYQSKIKVLRLDPNLVEHIDWLMGGSTVNKQRGDKKIVSSYWEEQDLVEELKKLLEN